MSLRVALVRFFAGLCAAGLATGCAPSNLETRLGPVSAQTPDAGAPTAAPQHGSDTDAQGGSAERPRAVLEAGDKPRSWKLPGTHTSMSIGG